MYHHRYRPPSHLANKNVTAFASNNYSINSASSANSSSATTSSSSSSQATTTSNISTLASLSEVRNHHSGTSSNNNNSNIVNNNSLSHNSAYTEVVSKSFAEERQDVIFRRVRGILNKITPETFDKLSKELVNVGLDSPRTLRGVIYLLFDKALKDLKYSSLYAKLCQELSEKAPNFEQESGPNTFCKFLISKCEDEFERRRKATEDFDAKNELTDEEFEQKAIAKQKMLGNIKFICELGKKRLLQEEILHECIRGLLSKKRERPVQDQAQDLECLCQIMRTIGSLLDIQASRNLMNQYFERIDMYSKRSELPSRIRFMLRDVIDLRNNNWRPRPFQREDNVPQPLSRLREEAGYEASQNLAIDKLGNNKSLLGLGDLPKLHGSKLSSLLLDDEPSFTTSNDFHWGPTFLTPDPSFDVFSSNVPPKNNSSSTKPIKLVGAPSVTMSSSSTQKHPPNLLTMNNVVNIQHQIDPFSNSFRGNIILDRVPSTIDSNNPSHHTNIVETRRIPVSSSNHPPPLVRFSDQRPINRNDSPPLSKPAPRKLQNNDIRPPSIHPPSYQSYKSSPRMNRHEREFAGRREQRRFGPPQFEQFDRPPKHSDHHQSNFHSDRNYRPAPSRNQNMDAQPAQDSNRAQNGRREANDASKTTPVTTKRDHLPAIAHAINGPLLPKPISKLSDSNFSLRPSHNLSGRALSGAAQQVGQPKQAGVSQSSRSTEGVANVKIEAKVSNDFTGKVDNSQTASKITKVDNQEKVSASLDTSRDACHDSHVNKFIAVLSECSKESRSNANRLASKIKELKIPKGCHSECLVSAIKQSIVRAENDREGTSKLLVQIVPSLIDAASLLNAFRIIFEQLHGLEVETPKVKSLVAGFLSRAVYDGLLTMEDVAQVLSGGKHHPLFLLFLQKLEKSAGQVWLNERFMASKIVLMDMVPEVDRTKERLAIALKDRCLGFLDPMLTIEPDLWEQMKSDPSPAIVYRWIKDNVDQTIQVSPTFAHVLIACLLKYIHSTAIERSKVTAIAEQQQQRDSDTDGSSKSSPTTTSSSQSIMDVEKEFLTKYQQVLQAILKDKHMQLACLYALQAFFNSLDCPKGALLRWFHMMYELNIVDDDVFFTWKEEINDEIPGKGQALFQVNSWLNWLAEAESDEDEEDEEDEDDNGEDDID